MNGLINVIQVIMIGNDAPVQLIKTYLRNLRKSNILVALHNKTITDIKMFLTIKAQHAHSKYNNQ